MTTTLGKVLVCATFVFSVLILGWALMFYVNRIDWTAKGELKKRQDRVKELDGALGIAQARYQSARQLLLARERQRPLDNAWYANQLKAVEFGAQGNREAPVLAVRASDQGVRPVPDPANMNRPVMVKATTRQGRDLLCITWYNDRLAQTRKTLESEHKALQETVAEDTRLTQELVGDKGLRQRIFDEKSKKGAVEAELEGLKAPQFNSLVEMELLAQRREQLERRVEELKKAGAASAARP
jgi:hypothetical protein